MILSLLMMLMAAVSAGTGRVIKRDAAGNPLTGTESKAPSLTEWANTDAPRPVFFANRSRLSDGASMATKDDLPVNYNVAFRGGESEIMAWQVRPDSDFTADTSEADVSLNVKEILYRKDNTPKMIHERELTLDDRITPPGGAGLTHAQGLDDDEDYTAGRYDDYLRFAPASNADWFLDGRQHVIPHDNAA